MSVVAAAIVTTGVVSAYSSSQAAESASESAEAGADAAAQAQIQSTQMQVDELRRQFDIQMEILQPQIDAQIGAQQAYADILGLPGPGGGTGPQRQAPIRGDYIRGSTLEQVQQRDRDLRRLQNERSQYDRDSDEYRSLTARMNMIYTQPITGEYMSPTEAQVRREMESRPGRTGMSRQNQLQGGRRRNYFVDPNIDPTRMADISRLPTALEENRLAGTTAERDPYRMYVDETGLAADTLEGDILRQDIEGRLLAEGAAGQGVYGDVFQESPGYAFQVEEMERQLERTRSAGGPNIGGRAVMEAQRRAQGLAAQDYYNWAAGRERDLGRLAQAEAQDAGRLDAAGRGYRALQLSEQQRGDQAYQDYMRRQEIDAGRAISGAEYMDRLEAGDIQRTDQAYYNYLDAVARQAGFGGGSAAQAVQVAGQQGQSVAGAYGQQGAGLSNIYANQGNLQAQIAANEWAGFNQAIQGTTSNYLTYNYLQSLPPAG